MKKEDSQAFVSLDLNYNVVDWSSDAEQFFGYSKEETLGKPAPHIPKEYMYELHNIIKSLTPQNTIRLRTKRIHKTEGEVDVDYFVSLLFDGKKTVGYRTEYRKVAASFIDNPVESEICDVLKNQTSKRTFENIRFLILSCLKQRQCTINQVASFANINWKTVENHLTYLVGRGLVSEIFSSEYVRIFEITTLGRERVEKLIRRKYKEFVKEKEDLYSDKNIVVIGKK